MLFPTLGSTPKLPNSTFPQDFIYVDSSNLLVAAQHVELARSGYVDQPSTAALQKLRHPQLRLNFRNLADFLVGSDPAVLGRLFAVYSCDCGGDSIGAHFRRAGFDTIGLIRRNGKEKAVDTHLILEATKDLVQAARTDVQAELTLVSGDADFLPLLELAQTYGFKSTVLAYKHGIANSVRRIADKVIELDEWHKTLTFCVKERG